MTGDIFGCHKWGEWYWHLVIGDKGSVLLHTLEENDLTNVPMPRLRHLGLNC